MIFSSDHGDMLYSNGYNRKQKPWDESIRVPMLWHYPAALGAKGRRLDALMSSEDVMPTLLGLCKVVAPKGLEGLDYSGYMRGMSENPNRENAALISCVAPFAEYDLIPPTRIEHAVPVLGAEIGDAEDAADDARDFQETIELLQ